MKNKDYSTGYPAGVTIGLVIGGLLTFLFVLMPLTLLQDRFAISPTYLGRLLFIIVNCWFAFLMLPQIRSIQGASRNISLWPGKRVLYAFVGIAAFGLMVLPPEYWMLSEGIKPPADAQTLKIIQGIYLASVVVYLPSLFTFMSSFVTQDDELVIRNNHEVILPGGHYRRTPFTNNICYLEKRTELSQDVFKVMCADGAYNLKVASAMEIDIGSAVACGIKELNLTETLRSAKDQCQQLLKAVANEKTYGQLLMGKPLTASTEDVSGLSIGLIVQVEANDTYYYPAGSSPVEL